MRPAIEKRLCTPDVEFVSWRVLSFFEYQQLTFPTGRLRQIIDVHVINDDAFHGRWSSLPSNQLRSASRVCTRLRSWVTLSTQSLTLKVGFFLWKLKVFFFISRENCVFLLVNWPFFQWVWYKSRCWWQKSVSKRPRCDFKLVFCGR